MEMNKKFFIGKLACNMRVELKGYPSEGPKVALLDIEVLDTSICKTIKNVETSELEETIASMELEIRDTIALRSNHNKVIDILQANGFT